MSESLRKSPEALESSESTDIESQRFIEEQVKLIKELQNETDSIQRVTQSAFIENRIATYFDPFLKRKDLTLEEIESKRTEVDTQAEMVVKAINEVLKGEGDSKNNNDLEAKLGEIYDLVFSYDKKLRNKAHKIETTLSKKLAEPQIKEVVKKIPKKMKTAATKQPVQPEETKEEPVTVVEEENTTPTADTEKLPEQDASIPLMVTKGMKQALADLGYSKAQRSSMKPEEAHNIIKEQKMFIKEADEDTQEVPETTLPEINTKADLGLVFPDGEQTQPPESPSDKIKKDAQARKEQEDKVIIKDLAHVTAFIENPDSIEITDENFEEIFDQVVEVLVHASKEAKATSDKEVINILNEEVKEIWKDTLGNIKRGIIKDTVKLEFLRNLCAEFGELSKALIKEIRKINKQEASKPKDPEPESFRAAKVETFEGFAHFLDKDLENLEINEENSKEIFADIKKVLNTEFKVAKKLDEAEFRAFANEMFDIKNNFNAKFENETAGPKLELINKIKGHIDRVFQEINITLGIKNPEEHVEQENPQDNTNTEIPAPIPTPAKESIGNQVGKIKSLGGINHFITKVLETMPDDTQELNKKLKEIKTAITSAFDQIKVDDKKGALETRNAVDNMIATLRDMDFSGEKVALRIKILYELTQFSLSLSEKAKEKPTPEVQAPAVKNPARTPAPTPSTEAPINTPPEPQPEKTRSIEDIVDFGDENSPVEIPEAIKKDKGFNSWIDRVINKGYDESPKTIEEWHTVYGEQNKKIKEIEAIFKDSKIGNELFKSFTNKSDKEFAYKKQIETLEHTLLTDPKGEVKVQAIIESYEKTKAQAEKIKSLENEKGKLNAGYSTKNYKLPEELVLRAIQGEHYELKNLESMEKFLMDMEHNYDHYKSALKGKEQDDVKLAKMFGLYTRTSDEHRESGLGFFKKLGAKIRNKMIKSKEAEDYDSKTEFKKKIRSLRDAGVFESDSVNKEVAQDNMFRLSRYVQAIKERVETENISVEKALAEETTEVASKILFQKVFPQYLKAVGENDRMQGQAKKAGVKKELFKSINEEISNAKSEEERLRNETISVIEGDSAEQNEFNTMVKQELTGESLDAIVKELGVKSLDAKTLGKLQEEFAAINQEDADELHYKRVSLQLAQAEVRFMANAKEVSLAPNSLKKYEAIFQDENLTPEEKGKYADTILKLLDEKLKKQKLNTVEQLEIKQFMRYFENQKATFKK